MRGSVENSRLRYNLKKNCRKNEGWGGGKFYTGHWGGVAIFPEAYGMLGVNNSLIGLVPVPLKSMLKNCEGSS
jgi:hypothetical protein